MCTVLNKKKKNTRSKVRENAKYEHQYIYYLPETFLGLIFGFTHTHLKDFYEHLFNFSLMQLSNSMHLGVWSWSRQSPELQTECQNGKET